MYNVVTRTLVGNSKGAITWTSFESKEEFDKWNDDKMQSWYQVVEEGVTEERATELCSGPEATVAAVRCMLGSALRLADDILAETRAD
jgi:hypothetical protein